MGIQISGDDSDKCGNEFKAFHVLPDHPLLPLLSWVPWARHQD